MLHVHQLISGHKIDSDPLYIKGFISEAAVTHLCLPISSTPTPRKSLSPHFFFIELLHPSLFLFGSNITIYTFQAVFWLFKEKSCFKRCLENACIWHILLFLGPVVIASISSPTEAKKINKASVKDGRHKLGTSPQSKLFREGTRFSVIVPSGSPSCGSLWVWVIPVRRMPHRKWSLRTAPPHLLLFSQIALH